MTLWKLCPCDQFTSDRTWYSRKQPHELEAILNNLARYLSQLKYAKNSFCVQSGYLHPEGKGVVAIDQKGGGGNLQETRLYVYADDGKKILYLITIGNKNDQQTDIKLAHSFADSLKNPP